MQETTADVRRDIEETRVRVSATLAELDTEVTSRRDAVKERIADVKDTVSAVPANVSSVVADFAREHPWYALGAALGIGLAVGRSGADGAAVRGAAGGAKSLASGAAGAAAGAAGAAAGKAKRLVHREGSSDTVASGAGMHSFSHEPSTGAIGSSAEDTGQADGRSGGGVFYRLKTGLVEAVTGSSLVEEMRREAQQIGRG